MIVKNESARLHHVGDVSIAPGEQKEIDDVFSKSLPAELVPVKQAAEKKLAKIALVEG